MYERDSRSAGTKPNAFGSARRESPIRSLFHSVPPATASRTAAPQGEEVFGCTAVCAARRVGSTKMKLDPKQNDRVRSSWRLRKSIPPSSEKPGPRYIPAQTASDTQRLMRAFVIAEAPLSSIHSVLFRGKRFVRLVRRADLPGGHRPVSCST